MNLTISGVHDLPDLSGVQAVISIRDPEEERPAEVDDLTVPVLDLIFHDTDGSDDLDTLPERWHLEQVEGFLARHLPERLHVHCYAGVSRSTAIATFALACFTPQLTEAQIVAAVRAQRPLATPNELLLRHIDAYAGRHFRRAWKQALRF
ncbi:hypothetical protein DKM44_01870 [Deinococcus irradiatisoli]|uniref:Tyrosine specific protein phosphatases domain-containing protein n=1 Tax=Deinococcus irradiatisoli TaxID=2202254 RepID=A0A2Z3JF81_9DEIO|nr:dual specificity protein phosphatase family protein [Deinococcus irradiatisoli]AWN22141.1 hypothetical protein DKM44_01870 [Deinococcus irradiatisoli]